MNSSNEKELSMTEEENCKATPKIRFAEGVGATTDCDKVCDEEATEEESPPLTSSGDETKIPTAQEIAHTAKMWAVSGQAYFPSDYTTKGLPPGYYVVEHCNRGYYFYKTPMNLDDLLILPDSATEEIIEHIEYFWTREAQFRELGFLWKRGIMLYGPAGGGKTSTLQLLSKRIIERGGLSIYLKNPHNTSHGLEILRRIEPDRPIIVLLEDIDALIKDCGESEILAILDGELQIDNVVFIATTNYPEDLDKRLINRPSRFDIVKEIGMPTSEARKIYLETKNPRLALQENQHELDRWVKESRGFSVAHLKEMILAVEALGESIDSVIVRLKKMMTQKPHSSDSENKSIGFVTRD